MRSTCLLIIALAVAMCAVTAQAGTIAHYNFDTDYSDSSGNGFDGVPTDGSGDADTGGVSISTTVGESVFGGGAASFTGERDWVAIPQQLIGSGNEYSVSFWTRDLSSDSTGGMAIGQPETNPGIFFVWLYKGVAYWRGSGSSGVANRNATFGPIATDSAWHHYALIAGDADGDSLVDDVTLYEDGNFVGTANDKLTGFIFEGIGEAYGNNLNFDWEGQIDEVWLFNEALSPAAVGSLYNINAVPEPTSLGLLLCGLLSLAGLRHGGRKS